MRCRGFTLVELLVVIAIIAILAAILIPTLIVAKDAARGTKCQTQLKQIMSAVHAYADDWDGYLPALNLWTTATGTGSEFDDLSGDIARGSLYAYLGKNKKIVCCPNDWRWKDKNYKDKFWYTYTVNSFCTWNTQGPPPYAMDGRLLSNWLGVPLSKFKNTTTAIFLVEENTDPKQGYLMNDALFYDIDITGDRHRGYAHVAYLDSHVGRVPAGVKQKNARWPSGRRIFH